MESTKLPENVAVSPISSGVVESATTEVDDHNLLNDAGGRVFAELRRGLIVCDHNGNCGPISYLTRDDDGTVNGVVYVNEMGSEEWQNVENIGIPKRGVLHDRIADLIAAEMGKVYPSKSVVNGDEGVAIDLDAVVRTGLELESELAGLTITDTSKRSIRANGVTFTMTRWVEDVELNEVLPRIEELNEKLNQLRTHCFRNRSEDGAA